MLYGGRTWKIGLWEHGEETYQAELQACDELWRQLQDADRTVILRIKSEVYPRREYGFEVSGVEIYEAVVQCQVRNTEEFDEWRVRRAKQIAISCQSENEDG